MKNEIKKITSFTVDHDKIVPGIYVSRIDGDITTYDLRTRKPNCNDYMDNLTMHSVEHMFATYIRNSKLKDDIIYFGPMGCQTGFYLLIRNSIEKNTINIILDTLNNIINHQGDIFGRERKECGNYLNLDLDAAKKECKMYLNTLLSYETINTNYPK